MKTVVNSGVLADKVAALGMQIQESPVHTLQYLEQLLSMGKKKGRREAGLAVDALKRLFLEDLLPKDRKLRRFENVMNLNISKIKKKHHVVSLWVILGYPLKQ